MTTSGACPRCGELREPHTDKTAACTICTRYNTLLGNSRKERRDGASPGLQMTLGEFAAWFVAQERTCRYCGIPEELVPLLGVLTQVGNTLSRLGLDRLDNTAPYRADNIALCCFACNKVKSNTFSPEEMRILGRGVALVWADRLGRPST